MTTTIAARYPGTCPECGCRWAEGDSITLHPFRGHGEWQHTTCPDDLGPTELRKGESVCETCWLVHPEGACDR